MDSRLNPFQDKMEKTLNNLEEEYAGIRAGRANPHILDKLRVDYYGTPSPIQSVANVSGRAARCRRGRSLHRAPSHGVRPPRARG